MTAQPDATQTLGYLEGRITEQSAMLQQLHTDVTAGFQQLRADMTAGLQQVNSRIDRVLLTGWIIGGAIIASQIGLVATLIIQGG